MNGLKDMDGKRVLYQNLNMHIHAIRLCEHAYNILIAHIPLQFFFSIGVQ